MKKITQLLLLFTCITNVGCSQTTLTTGDIAFVGYNADGSDDFSFFLLKDITTNTTITFTDKGWLSSGGFTFSYLQEQLYTIIKTP